MQASALLLFNLSDRLSYQEIMTQLNLSDDDVVRLLHSLSCAKYKILLKEPNTKTISPTDYFEFNSKFTDKMRRIKVFECNILLSLYLDLLYNWVDILKHNVLIVGVNESRMLNMLVIPKCNIQIPLPPVDEKKKVIEDVDKDRRYAIDASIVRIMKSRKVLGYQQLVMECVEQLGRMFKVSKCFSFYF